MKAIILALGKNSSFKKLVNKIIKSVDEPHEKIIFNIFLIILFSFIYRFISFYDKKSFSEELNMKDCLYFSSITNFTLGYGDILPISSIAKFTVVIHSLIFWMVAIA